MEARRNVIDNKQNIELGLLGATPKKYIGGGFVIITGEAINKAMYKKECPVGQ